MSRHHHNQLLNFRCDLPNEFLIAYPQPQPLHYNQQEYSHLQKKREGHRNTNALETSFPSRYKAKNLLHPYRASKDYHAEDIHTSRRKMKKKIMSIDSSDHEVEFYMVKESTMSARRDHLSQMAGGDKKNENVSDKFQQQRFMNDQEHIMKMIHKDLIRPIPCKPTINSRLKQSSNLKSFKNPISYLSSSQIYQSTLPLDRTSTWRKLQTNITPSHYHHIQQFQRERQQEYRSSLVRQPIMLSPLNKEPDTDSSDTPKVILNMTNSCISSISLSIDSPSNLSDCSNDNRIIKSIHSNQQLLDDHDNSDTNIPITSLMKTAHMQETYHTENEEKLLPNSLSTSSSKNILNDNPSVKASLLYEIENIEEFQPVIDILSPSQVSPVLLNDILSSFFPIISSNPLASTSSLNNPLVFQSHHHTNTGIGEAQYMLLDDSSDMNEFLIISPPPLRAKFDISKSFIIEEVSENDQPNKVQSLFQSIEELCILIRQLLQYELTEQKTTPLQATITSQLAILLTYLAVPNNTKIFSGLIAKETIERMTLTDENYLLPKQSLVSTVGTQTDIERTIQLHDHPSKMLLQPSNNVHYHTESVQDIVELNVRKSSSSLCETKQKKIIDIPSSLQKAGSHTELISTSISLHLPGRRPIHSLSDTFIYHIRHHEQCSSSYHQFISFSEITIHSLIHRRSTKPETEHLLKRIGQQFQHYMELKSSNTCLEASTEFTPDFLVTTFNNSKYDDDDDDETEQFGIDTEKQDYQIDTMSSIIKEKIDTLTFNSIDKGDYDSLDLEIEQGSKEYPLSISIGNHHSIDGSTTEDDGIPKSVPLDADLVPFVIDQLHDQEHFCQLLEPLMNAYQWQVPVLLRKTTSVDLLFEKQTAKIDFKYLKIRSNSNNGMNIIGQRVRIKSNSSSQASTAANKSHLSQEISIKSSTLNHNNNYNDYTYSTQSIESSISTTDARLSPTSIDSLYILNNDSDESIILPTNCPLMMNYSKSDELILRSSSSDIHENNDKSHLSEVTDRFDSNIQLEQSLLDMLDSLNHNNSASTENIDLLHMYIRTFLIEFDARICLDRKRRKRSTRKHEKVVH